MTLVARARPHALQRGRRAVVRCGATLQLILAAFVVSSCGPGRPVSHGGEDGAGNSVGGSGDAPGSGSSRSEDESAEAGSSTSAPSQADCGNGLVEGSEECDDGNRVNFDGCDWDCVAVPAVQVTAGATSNVVCAWTDNLLSCWGVNRWGQLGIGTSGVCDDVLHCNGACCVGDDETPAEIGAIEMDGLSQVSVGATQTCVVRHGDVYCWGLVTSALGLPARFAECPAVSVGEVGLCASDPRCCLGDDEPVTTLEPVDVGGPVAQVLAAGVTCALLRDGTVRCWGVGAGLGLALGDEAIGDDESPSAAPVVEVGAAVAQLAGTGPVCALTTSGGVRCWGWCWLDENYQQVAGCLGYGGAEPVGDDETPASAGDLPLADRAVQISSRYQTTCALLENGGIQCWGLNIGLELDSAADAPVYILPAGAKRVVVGGTPSYCGLSSDGVVTCWGHAFGLGELGRGDGVETVVDPVAFGLAVDIGGPALALAHTGSPNCAIRDDLNVFCWGGYANVGVTGLGSAEPVGDDETPASRGPVPLPW